MPSYLSPIKINLFLHVLNRREDGYHNLQTLFKILPWGDHLNISATSNHFIQFKQSANSSVSLAGINAEDNLIIRAAKRLQHHCSLKLGAYIEIEKHIPMGAGLGGASSNAATTLCALNDLWQCGLDKETLSHLARDLGADVPIFIYGKDAFAEGIGEQLTPITLPEKWYLVVTPPIFISTKNIFSYSDLTTNHKHITILALSSQVDRLINEGWVYDDIDRTRAKKVTLRNQLSEIVDVCYPQMKQFKQQLNEKINKKKLQVSALNSFKKTVPSFKMSGSGSSFFVMFDRKDLAEEVQQLLHTDIETKHWLSVLIKC